MDVVLRLPPLLPVDHHHHCYYYLPPPLPLCCRVLSRVGGPGFLQGLFTTVVTMVVWCPRVQTWTFERSAQRSALTKRPWNQGMRRAMKEWSAL